MAWILDRLKEKFGEDEEIEGFPDLNYVVGMSSAMDIGEVPTPMDERIGYAAQIGGSLMELQITNPATFSLERDDMIAAISQLGLDVTLHPDMNAGFTMSYRSGQGEQYGYETVEQYFTNYLQELAAFKKHVENLPEKHQFNIGRINPHISTSPMPPLEERMETDVGVDPFGYTINKYDENSRKQRNHFKQNIYKNPDFLKKLYQTLFLEIVDYPFQNYQTFAAYSDKFDEEWLKAQHKAANDIFKSETDDSSPYKSAESKLATILTAQQQDQGIGNSWREILDQWESSNKFPIFNIEVEEIENDEGETEVVFQELEETGKTSNFSQILSGFSGQATRPENFRQLDRILYNLKETNAPGPNRENPQEFFSTFLENPEILTVIGERDQERVLNRILSELEARSNDWIEELSETLKYLWNPNSIKPQEQNISQQAKFTGLQSHLEVQQIRLLETAYQFGKSIDEIENVEELAAEVFAGEDPEELFDPGDRQDIEDAEAMHEDLLERILSGQQFQREMWKESTMFYQIIPAWMSSSDYDESEAHPGWDAPKFIWDRLVMDKWGKMEDVDINLEDPRNGMEGTEKYMDLLEKSDKFRMDVAAAVGAVYVWAHFTQRKVQFNLRDRDFGLSDEEAEEVEHEGWTWIEWMNEFGIGVNMETMAGSPQSLFKIWRPKDISIAAHAINKTARAELDEVHEDLDGCPAKFTIDMEHVATMGAPPWEEMKIFMELEEELAEKDPELGIDPEKPVAKILRQYHIMDPGVEAQRGTHHGALDRGNDMIYNWLFKMVKNGFARNENEPATILFELAEHKGESSYMMRTMMNLVELGVEPEDLDPSRVDPGEEPEDEVEALIARFYGMEQTNYNREWAKIEEHAFDPLKGLLEAEEFDYTYSGRAAMDNDNRPQEWNAEEYK